MANGMLARLYICQTDNDGTNYIYKKVLIFIIEILGGVFN